MNCPICDQEMTLREQHAFLRGSGDPPYEFRVHVCHSAMRGFEPGEKYGKRCEETLYYEPVLPNGDPARGLPVLITGLDRAPPDAAAPSQGTTASVEENARDSE